MNKIELNIKRAVAEAAKPYIPESCPERAERNDGTGPSLDFYIDADFLRGGASLSTTTVKCVDAIPTSAVCLSCKLLFGLNLRLQKNMN